MNSRGRCGFTNLNTCKVCGMDSGIRKVSVKVPEKFYVVCEVCGFKTRPHTTQAGATREWNYRKEKIC